MIFEKIKNNKCNYYIFVNDRTVMQYKVGNYLTFKCNEESVKVVIEEQLYFKTVKELLDMVGKNKFGYTQSQNNDKIEDMYYVNYKAEDIEKFGLVAVKFKLV